MSNNNILHFKVKNTKKAETSMQFHTIFFLLQILNTMLVLLVFIGLNLAASSWAYGPSFVRTPSQTVLYSNTTGLILDCVARGEPPPVIDWVDQNGNILSIHPSYAR